MARPIKTGLDYFPLDVGFFSDIKIKKLIRYQSVGAISVYLYLLDEIYKQGYFLTWDDDLPFIISDQLKCEENFVQTAINYCIEISLFSAKMYQNNGVLTSKGIQIRYSKICNLAKRVSIIDRYNLIEPLVSSEETIDNIEITEVYHKTIAIPTEETEVNYESSTQRKGKERKGKESSITFTPPLLDEVKQYFSENGYTEDAAAKAFKYYQEGNWHDKDKKAVKNWKQKMIGVWFKPENLKSSISTSRPFVA